MMRAEFCALQRPCFRQNSGSAADALVHAPAASRKHGVYLSATDLQAA
jgi:hypothetical protein